RSRRARGIIRRVRGRHVSARYHLWEIVRSVRLSASATADHAELRRDQAEARRAKAGRRVRRKPDTTYSRLRRHGRWDALFRGLLEGVGQFDQARFAAGRAGEADAERARLRV